MGILQLPEPELVFGPPVIGIDPFDLPPLDFEEDDLYICPESQYVPSLKEHLAAGDDVILLRLVTEPHLVEERIQELRELADLNENVLKLIALYTLTHIEDEDADIDDVRELLEGLIAAQGSAASYLESLADLIGPIGGYGGNPSWRSVSVYAVADEAYIMVHGANWRIAIGNIIEAGDNEFESQFQINFVVEERMSWDSNDAHTTLHALFNEVRSEVKPDRSIYNVMAAFTGQYT
ncbi:hypothetical protein M1O47_04005, partial [Dehalococcoidia bacterium]|nr:hypothetical protein [Dehalococcoidia bacterium]